MLKDTKSLGNNKAPACESRGFVLKKKVCFLTHLLFISIPQIGAVSSYHTLYSERKPLYRIQLDLQVRIKKKYHDLRNSSNFKSKSLKKTCTKIPLSLLRNLKLIDPSLYTLIPQHFDLTLFISS